MLTGLANRIRGLQANVDLLASTFGRPVVGVHNKTVGAPFDLIEWSVSSCNACATKHLLIRMYRSLIQRDFSYNTSDVRVAYDYVKACLCDPTVQKVVLVGHSQGGIIVSMVIDELLTDLPQEVFGKIVRSTALTVQLQRLGN